MALEKASSASQLRDLQYDYEGALTKERKGSDVLLKFCSTAEEASQNTELFRTTVRTYNDWLRTDLCEGFAAVLMQLRDLTKEMIKKRYFGTKKRVDVNFSVLYEMLQAWKTELSHLGSSLTPVD